MRIQGILITVKLCLIQMCSSVCPNQWPLPQVMHCLYNITNGLNGTNVLAGTSTETVQMYCDNGTFNRSINCVTKLYNDCGSKLIGQFTEPSEYRNAVETLCSNLTEHAKYSACIVEQRPKIKSCLAHNDRIFQNSVDSQKNQDWTQLKIKLCSYFEGMKICTSDPVSRNCGVTIGRTLGNFLSSVIPKLCSPGYENYFAKSSSSSGTQFHHVSYMNYLFTPLLIVWYKLQ